MTHAEIQAIWDQVRAIDEVLEPLKARWDELDHLLRYALANYGHDDILAAYDHRMLTRHADYPDFQAAFDERRRLLKMLPKSSDKPLKRRN